MQAGNDYQAMPDSLEAQDITNAQSQAAALVETPYAPLAVLDLARPRVESRQRDDALATPPGADTSKPALPHIPHPGLDLRRHAPAQAAADPKGVGTARANPDHRLTE